MHDGLPYTDAEMADYMNDDPCMMIVRLLEI